MSRIILSGGSNFRPDHTFDCGQCFRWDREEDGSYTGIAGRKIARIYGSDERIIIESPDRTADRVFWENYLDLNRDYGKIRDYLGKRDTVIREAMEFGRGIRLLNQDKWETLISFIISANNNIPRIKKNINMLAEMFGKPAGGFRGREFYELPEPEVLAQLTEKDLAPIRLGYRAPYLIKTAKMVADDGCCIREDRLRGYVGVGPKVASCISLFAFDNVDSFPIDTWVKQVMNKLYGIDKKDTEAMKKLAEDKFSPYGGIAQQYLFYFIREKS